MLTGMSAPGPEPAPRPVDHRGWTAGRIVLVVASTLMGLPFLLGLWLVLSSALGDDPHGYLVLVGTFLVLVPGILLVRLVPWLLPERLRLRGCGLALLGYVLVAVLVGAMLADL